MLKISRNSHIYSRTFFLRTLSKNIPNSKFSFSRNGFDSQNYSEYLKTSENAYEQYEKDKYKPNFPLKFDENGQALIYKMKLNINWKILALQMLGIGYFGYKLIFEFNELTVLSFVLYSLPFLYFSFMFRQNLLMGQRACRNIKLNQNGNSFTYSTLTSINENLVNIADLGAESTKITTLDEYHEFAKVTLKNTFFKLNLSRDEDIYIPDYDLLKAVLTGHEVDVDTDAEDTYSF